MGPGSVRAGQRGAPGATTRRTALTMVTRDGDVSGAPVEGSRNSGAAMWAGTRPQA